MNLFETDPEVIAKNAIDMGAFTVRQHGRSQVITEDFKNMRLLAIGDLTANDNMNVFVKAACVYAKTLILYEPKIADDIRKVAITYGDEFAKNIDAAINRILLLI